MGNLFVGFVLGICATTIGFAGMARYADAFTHKIQDIVKRELPHSSNNQKDE
jgi:hypothetical protein